MAEDEAESAHRVLQRVIKLSDEAQADPKKKNPAAVALGRLGGLAGGHKGGKARARKLSDERRREIARNAARARWSVVKDRETKE